MTSTSPKPQFWAFCGSQGLGWMGIASLIAPGCKLRVLLILTLQNKPPVRPRGASRRSHGRGDQAARFSGNFKKHVKGVVRFSLVSGCSGMACAYTLSRIVPQSSRLLCGSGPEWLCLCLERHQAV